MSLTHVSRNFPIISKKTPFINKSFEKLLNVCKDLDSTVYSEPVKQQQSYVIQKIKFVNEAILRFCKDSASLNDVVTVYRTLCKIRLYNHSKEIDDNNEIVPVGRENQIFDKNAFKFTLFSIEDQFVKAIKYLNPYQIVYLLFSHFRSGRENQIFVQALLSVFVDQNSRALNSSFFINSPKIISLLARALYKSKCYDINNLTLDKLIALITSQTIKNAKEFTLSDTVLLTDSLIKLGYDLIKVSDILFRILTRNTSEISSVKETLNSFSDVHQFSMLIGIFAQCCPIDFNTGHKDKLEMWVIMIDKYTALVGNSLDVYPLSIILQSIDTSNNMLMKLSNKIKYNEVDSSIEYLLYKKIILLLNIYCDITIEALSASKNFFSVLKLIKSTLFGISKLRLEKRGYLALVGNNFMKDDFLLNANMNLISSICYYFAKCDYFHPFIPLVISRFIQVQTIDVTDFNHIIYAFGKFSIYSESFIKWVVKVCTTRYLDQMSAKGPEGLVYLFYYLMSYAIHNEPIGFNLTYQLALKIKQGIRNDIELYELYNKSKMIYKAIPTDTMDCWAKRESIDPVSARWAIQQL